MPAWALPRLSTIAPIVGIPFTVLRARGCGYARARALSEAKLSAIGRKGGLASQKARTDEQRREWARVNAIRGNQARWG